MVSNLNSCERLPDEPLMGSLGGVVLLSAAGKMLLLLPSCAPSVLVVLASLDTLLRAKETTATCAPCPASVGGTRMQTYASALLPRLRLGGLAWIHDVCSEFV